MTTPAAIARSGDGRLESTTPTNGPRLEIGGSPIIESTRSRDGVKLLSAKAGSSRESESRDKVWARGGGRHGRVEGRLGGAVRRPFFGGIKIGHEGLDTKKKNLRIKVWS